MAEIEFTPLIGYARVSTQDQETTLQLDALRAAGVSKIYEEKASGASLERRHVLKTILANIRPGQTLVVYKIDRIARSLSDLLQILSHLDARKATIKSLTEPIDTSSAMGAFVVQILGAVAQLERAIIRERSIAGQKAAVARGARVGRRRALNPDDESRLVAEYSQGHHTMQHLAIKYGISLSAAKRCIYRATKTADYLRICKI